MYELLTEAAKVLDECGREVAPEGYEYVDIPAFLPTRSTFQPGGPTPFAVRLRNNYKTQFIVVGIIFECNYPVRVKWPNGRYLSQSPSFDLSEGSPIGAGANMIALAADVAIEAQQTITIEISQT